MSQTQTQPRHLSMTRRETVSHRIHVIQPIVGRYCGAIVYDTMELHTTIHFGKLI